MGEWIDIKHRPAPFQRVRLLIKGKPGNASLFWPHEDAEFVTDAPSHILAWPQLAAMISRWKPEPE